MKTSDSIVKIATALLEAQKVIGAAKKDAVNPFYHSNYADLGAVMEVCKKPLNDNGITVLQPIMGAFVETVLLHVSGEWISSETPIIAKEAANPQATGSAITYARRYGLQSMVFIPSEDDDAERATRTQSRAKDTSKPVGAVVSPTTNTCIECHAPRGKQHATNCSVGKDEGANTVGYITSPI